MTIDDRRREAEHADSCWDGCDDLHPGECGFCGRQDCEDDCVGDGSEPWSPGVVTEYGFAERGML